MLPDGRRLEVRDVRPEDADGLEALFAQLPQGDRYLRFFTGGKPPREFVEAMASQEPGSVRLVAEVGGEIVAEASAQRLPDGDGELGITVARDWRGGLGWLLLRMLKTSAKNRGVRNLQAEVLTVNGPMLSLVRREAYAVQGRPDWASVRVVMGTGTETPLWPGTGRHGRWRVLVESASGHWPGVDEARAAGVDVLVCPGPGADRSRCPALRGTVCPLAAEADLVVNGLAVDGLGEAHAALHGGVPVCAGPSAREALARFAR